MLGIGDFARLAQVSRRMLRHYDELGILTPARVDPTTGYRYYAVDQLADAHRIVALRDLGLGLEQIRALVAEDVSVEQLRGMLRLRQAEIATSIREDQKRLQRVEAHLDAIEHHHRIIVKQTDPIWVALSTYKAAGYGYENISPIFDEHLEGITTRLLDQGKSLGVCVATYEELPDSEEVLVHLGWEVDDEVVAGDGLRVEELPIVEVAATVHRGPMNDILSVYESMVRWIEASGFQLAGNGRELYRNIGVDESEMVTEVQLPIARVS